VSCITHQNSKSLSDPYPRVPKDKNEKPIEKESRAIH
jgi:hypothetical protein